MWGFAPKHGHKMEVDGAPQQRIAGAACYSSATGNFEGNQHQSVADICMMVATALSHPALGSLALNITNFLKKTLT